MDQQTLLTAIETSLFCLPELPGKVQHLHIPGLQGRAIDGSDPFVSLVGAARLDEAHTDSVIQQVFRLFSGQGKAFGWMTSPFSTPADLGDRLARAGMEKALELAGLALTELDRPIPSNPEVQIEPAAAVDIERDSWLLSESIGFTPEGARATHEALLLGNGPGCASVYLAYLPETPEPVGYAASILLPDQPIVLLYCAATLEACRGRGVYTSLVSCRLEEAKRLGAQAAVIQAVRNSSAPILIKLGFSELFSLDWYIWEPGKEAE